MGKIHCFKDELRGHMLEYIDTLRGEGLTDDEIDARIGMYYTNVMIRKYSNEEQDKMWDELYHLIMEVPGGYWQVVDNMDYMPVFEHRKFKKLKSQFGQK
jgi:hypothetical protein